MNQMDKDNSFYCSYDNTMNNKRSNQNQNKNHSNNYNHNNNVRSYNQNNYANSQKIKISSEINKIWNAK